MTINAVSEGDPVTASSTNEIISNVNSSPGRVVFTSNGTFSVPAGVHQFKVWLTGGGGKGSAGFTDFEGSSGDGYSGGNSPLASAIISGQDIGSSFAITIGAGSSSSAPGGTSSFGTLLSCSGGGLGPGSTNFVYGAYIPTHNKGSFGNVTPGAGVSYLIHDNSYFVHSMSPTPLGYGEGGLGALHTSQSFAALNGRPGICVIEW